MKSLTFLVFDMCSKPIFCSNVAQKGNIANLVPRVLSYHHGNEVENLLEVARIAKSCSKRQRMLKSCRVPSGKA